MSIKGLKGVKMPKMSKKSNIISFALGMVLTFPFAYAATTVLESTFVSYDNSSSGLNSETVQDAIDELYGMTGGCPKGYVCEKMPTTYANGTAVYFNPVTGTKCTEGTTNCELWYTFLDSDDAKTVNMIMSRNLTSTTFYISTNRIKTLTAEWNEAVASTARAIDATEVAQIVGKTDFVLTNVASWFYFDSKDDWHNQTANSTNKSQYAWLYNNLKNCEQYGCTKQDQNAETGYWTSQLGDGMNAWYVNYRGRLRDDTPNISYGFRPVISVSKSIIS